MQDSEQHLTVLASQCCIRRYLMDRNEKNGFGNLSASAWLFMSTKMNKLKAGKPVQRAATDYDAVLAGVVELLDAARRRLLAWSIL